jgi:hypothetical protein
MKPHTLATTPLEGHAYGVFIVKLQRANVRSREECVEG